MIPIEEINYLNQILDYSIEENNNSEKVIDINAMMKKSPKNPLKLYLVMKVKIKCLKLNL